MMGILRTITGFNFIIHTLLIHPTHSSPTPNRVLQRRVRSQNNFLEPQITDWEIGLREATYQALIKDGYSPHSNLQNLIYKAPILNKNFPSANFGDIVLLAKGQLYTSPSTGALSFVQDNQRKYLPISNQDILLALWTVKRIRHRDEVYGHRYEVEYIISPIQNGVAPKKRDGEIDYEIPGHIFIIRSNPRYTSGNRKQLVGHRKKIDVPSGTTIDPRHVEIQLYRNLINSLAAKTSPSSGHRFTPNLNSAYPSTESSISTTQGGQFQILTPIFPTQHTQSYFPSTKSPQKTTFHFFAAAEDEEENEDIFSTKYVGKIPKKTTPKFDYEDEEIDLFPSLKPTEAMRKITQETTGKSAQTFTTEALKSTKKYSDFPLKTTQKLVEVGPTEAVKYSPKYEEIDVTKPLRSTQKLSSSNQKTTQKYSGTTLFVDKTGTNFYPSLKPTEPISTQKYQETTPRYTTEAPFRDTSPNANQISPPSFQKTTVSLPSYYPTTFATEKTTTQQNRETITPTDGAEKNLLTIVTPENYGNYASTTSSGEDSVKTTLIFPSTGIISTTFTPKKTTQVHTTNFQIETEIRPTQTERVYTTPGPTPTNRSKPKSSTGFKDDFLLDADVEEAPKSSGSSSKSKDYTIDDIFGTNQKIQFTTEPTRTVVKTPKIIYSDFFQASTVPPTSSLTQFYAESQNNFITKPLESPTTELNFPLTSQSYLTSISYKVNKKTTKSDDEFEIIPTVKAKLSNLIENQKLKLYKAELPEENELKRAKIEKKVFDEIALQLVNHARGLDFLQKNEVEKVRPSKFKRRNLYSAKLRKNFRK